jgi:hypothetical protein
LRTSISRRVKAMAGFASCMRHPALARSSLSWTGRRQRASLGCAYHHPTETRRRIHFLRHLQCSPHHRVCTELLPATQLWRDRCVQTEKLRAALSTPHVSAFSATVKRLLRCSATHMSQSLHARPPPAGKSQARLRSLWPFD